MRFDYSEAQWVGIAFVFLGLVLGLAWLVRRYVPPFAALLLPSSVIAGFVMLLIGPQLLGSWTGPTVWSRWRCSTPGGPFPG